MRPQFWISVFKWRIDQERQYVTPIDAADSDAGDEPVTADRPGARRLVSSESPSCADHGGRSIAAGTYSDTFRGGSSAAYTGIIYGPKSTMTFHGNASLTAYTIIVSRHPTAAVPPPPPAFRFPAPAGRSSAATDRGDAAGACAGARAVDRTGVRDGPLAGGANL
ncbi:MAG: hypothetical protein DMG57_27230 [Acidobacteria bacterium]|nr:MAG: hypothetical protein DMG57_27230 [Acidobacteriota bacterium]